MSAITKEYIGSIVEKIASIHNLENHEFSIEKFEAIAQNFFGVLIPITLKATKDDKPVSIDLVLKLAPTDERYRVSGAVTLMFAREMYFYSILHEKYTEIQATFPPKLQHLMPKHYYICKDYCNEVIAMENMCSFGYEPFKNSNYLDFDHTVLALEALAKFHALSFVLKERDDNMFKEVEKICVPFTQETNNRFMVIILDRLEKAIQKFAGMAKYLALLRHMKEHCVSHVEAAAFSINQKCICHGDIWKENILYKYDVDRKPLSSCLIDYQTVRISSAAYDALFLITTSTSKSLRGNNKYYNLLDIYFNTFTEFLNEAGLSADKVYSRKMFDDDLKIVAPSCFIIANTALWLSSGLQEQGHVRSKQVFKTEAEREEAVDKYRSRVQDIIEDYVSFKYFEALENY